MNSNDLKEPLIVVHAKQERKSFEKK